MIRKTMVRAIVLLGLVAGAVTAQRQDPGEADRRQQAAALLGRPAGRLGSVQIATVHLRGLGRDVTLLKARDHATGEVIGGAFDTAGSAVDFSALRALEVAARQSRPELKIDPLLARALETADPDEPVRVGLWLHYSQGQYDQATEALFAAAAGDDEERIDAAERAAGEYVMARNAELTAPVVDLLVGIGVSPRYVSTTAPVIFVTVPPARVPGLALLPQVDTVYLETLDREEDNEQAHRTHRTDRVHDFGVKGKFRRVAVLEDNGVDPACPWLDVSAWFNPNAPNPDDHIHATAGCIASTLDGRIGVAPAADLYIANAAAYTDADVITAADWIVTQNVDATNLSFGQNTSGAVDMLTRYFEYQSRNFSDSYVASAGNSGQSQNPYVGAPGLAYNLVSVGSFGDAGTTSWLDDTISAFSSYGYPSTGCTKPNLAAVGEMVDTLGDGTVNVQFAACPGVAQPAPWLIENYCGTSFAAPFVTGNLINAMSQTTVLRTFPEAAMAMLCATAWHNIHGPPVLSTRDGAGGLHGLAMYRATKAGRALGGFLSPGSFNNNGYHVRNIWLQGGDPVRLCLAWSANASATYSTSTLDADLDIEIFGGQNQTSGTSYASSSSSLNNFEIVQFTPPTTGWYTVRIDDARFDGTSERFGLCWSQKQADGASARLREYTAEAATDGGPTIGNAFYFMDIQAPGSPGASYITYPGASMAAGLSFSTSSWAPVDYDVWTDIWFNGLGVTGGPTFWTNSAGTLTGLGTLLGQYMFLPDFPPLIGLPLHHVSAMIDPAAGGDLVTEISEVHTFEFWPDPITKLRTDDGDFRQSLPFGFDFYGQTYTECFVNMNGNVTFGAPDTDWSQTSAEMLSGQPRIAALWTDLGPHQISFQGTPIVQVREIFTNNQKVVIEFINVPLRVPGLSGIPGIGDNTFRITLAADNSITLEHRDCDLDEAIVGISPGSNLSFVPEVDLTGSGDTFGGVGGAIYQVFSGGGDDFDLDADSSRHYGKVRFEPSSSSATGYRLRVDID